MTTEGGTRGRVGADCQAEALRQTGYRQPTERDLNPRFRGHQPGALPTGLSALDAAKRAQDGHCRRIVSVPGGTIDSVKDEPTDDERETVSSWTNPYTAEYKRRQAMVMAMRPFELIATLRDLNLTSYAFSKNAEELQAHVAQFPQIGNSQPFNSDVGDPFA